MENLSRKKLVGFIVLVFILIGSSTIGPVMATEGKSDIKERTSSKDVKRVVVEFESPSILSNIALKDGNFSGKKLDKVQTLKKELQSLHQNVINQARDQGVDVRQRGEYTFAFNGIALEVEEEDIKKLVDLPQVKAVHPDHHYHASLDQSVPLIRAPEVWSMQDGEGRDVTGKSVTVAILDTGVDYTHPDLGGGFGQGNKVVDGYDFINDDDDPIDDNGHGTHVAGIVAANGSLSGVAPDATITAYKVLDQDGFGDLSTILAGIEAAIDPGNPHRADVLNMSLSGPGDGYDPLSRAAQNAVDAGVVVVAAAGNDGPGNGTIGAPGAANGVLTVGASVSGVTVPEMKLMTPEKKRLSVDQEAFSAKPPNEESAAELVDVGDGMPEDYEGVDVHGKALLIKATPQNFDKARFAEEKGALAVLFHRARSAGPVSTKKGAAFQDQGDSENEKELHDFTVGASDDSRLEKLVAVTINGPTADELRSYLAAGSAEIAISGIDATDQMAAFSSRGPTTAFYSKPDLVAPGVDIHSTFPENLMDSGYLRMSGTSMAAPHAAGAAALLKQLHPDWRAHDIADALTGSAKPLDSYDPLTQGAGRIDIKAAADATVVASPRALSYVLADFHRTDIENRESVTLTNHGDEPANIRLSVRDRSTINANVDISPSVINIGPGEQVQVDVDISLTRPDQDADVMGWLEGSVETSNGESHLRIPYHLAVRTLQLYTSPDPTVTGGSEVFIYSPADLEQAPTVTVHTPKGKEKRVSSKHDHDRWWRATVETEHPGIFRIEASAVTAKNAGQKEVTLIGSSTLEVLQDQRGTSTWQPVGPNSSGGKFAFDPRKRQTLFALSPNTAGIFVSNDEAKTWTELRNLPVAGGIPFEIVFDPKKGKNMYLAINSGGADPAYRGKLLMSSDKGKSWTSLPFPDLKISDMELSETGRLFSLIGDGRVYVSPDGGVNWETVTGPWGDNVADTLFHGDDLFIAAPDGVYVVRNISSGSRTPERVFQSRGSWGITYLAGDDNVLLANEQFGDLYISYDRGETWKRLFEPPSNIWMLRLVDQDIYLSMSGSIWVGKNYGKSWQQWDSPAPVPQSDVGMPSASTPAARNPLYIGSERVGIFTTKNSGQSYERAGVPGATLYDVALSADEAGPVLIAGTEWDSYRTALPTEKKVGASTLDWGASDKEGYFGARATLVASSTDNPNIVYKTVVVDPIDTFNVLRSEDGGKTWKQLTKGSEVPYAILVHPANPDHVYISYWSLSGSGLLVSHDGGDSWKTIASERPAAALVGDPNNVKRIWAGDETGLYVSENGGVAFKKLQNKPVNALAISPKNPNHLIVGGKELYTSQDGGRTLQAATYENIKFNVNDIVFSPRNPNVAYAATGSFYEAGLLKGGRGVLRSSDGGRTWHNISYGLNNLDTTALTITSDDKYLFVGTTSGGVYRLELDKASAKKQ